MHFDEVGGVEEDAECRADENGHFGSLRGALCARVDVGVPATESGARVTLATVERAQSV